MADAEDLRSCHSDTSAHNTDRGDPGPRLKFVQKEEMRLSTFPRLVVEFGPAAFWLTINPSELPWSVLMKAKPKYWGKYQHTLEW